METRISKWKWLILTPMGNFWIHITLMFFLILLFILTRIVLNDSYRADTRSSVTSISGLFQITITKETGIYELFFQGMPFDPSSIDELDDVGIAKQNPVKGYLAGIRNDIQTSNRAIATETRYLMSLISKSGSEWVISADILLNQTDQSQPERFIYFILPNGIDPRRTPLTYEGLHAITNHIYSGTCRYRGQYLSELDNGVVDATASISEKLKELKRATEHPLCSNLVMKLLSISLEKRLLNATSSIARYIKPRCDESEECSSEQSSCNASVCFHHHIAKLWMDQLSFFWLFGNWKWFDIWMITMFGVMIEAMSRLGSHIANRAPENEIYNAGETQRTILKLFYAPIMSIVVIWTLIATDVLTIDISGIAGETTIVTLALIFGLFPNVPYSLLERLAKTILRRTTIASDTRKGHVSFNKITTSAAEKNELPTIARLRENIKAHAVAPLKGPNL